MASARFGSPTGSTGSCFRFPMKKKNHKPPAASAAPMSHMFGKARDVNSGRVIQKRSTKRIRISQMATAGRILGLRLRARESSKKKGTKKRKMTTMTATTPHWLGGG